MNITDNFRVKVIDDLNLVLEEKRLVTKKDKTQQYEWKFFGYYSSLKFAIKSAIEKEMLNSLKEEQNIFDIYNKLEEQKEIIYNLECEELFIGFRIKLIEKDKEIKNLKSEINLLKKKVKED